jgi:hypothetical protein
MRRSVLIAVAALLPLVVPATGGATDLFNTSGASVTCSTVIGTTKISPPLNLTAAIPSTVFKIKAVLGGCVSTGATPSEPTIVSGKLSATLTLPPGANCLALANPSSATGNMVVKWKTASGTLDFPTTTVAPGIVTGTPGVIPPLVGSYASISSGGAFVGSSNAFAFGTPSFLAVIGEDILNLTPLCGLPVGKGIKLVHLGPGQLTM